VRYQPGPLIFYIMQAHFLTVDRIEDIREFRERVKRQREREWIRDAIRTRKFTGEETFRQGLDLIRFAMRIHEVGEHARHG